MKNCFNIKRISFLALMFVSILNFSQPSNLKISNLPPESEISIFPLISFKQQPLIENKINTFLQVRELEFVPFSGKNPFQFASTATNSYTNYVYFYSWKKLESPKNILSLELNGEASGAYPEGFTNYRNFELRTGDLINLADLFQPKFYKEIEGIVQDVVRNKVENYIATLKSEDDKSEDAQERIMMYEDCFTDFELKYLKFYFGKDQITVIAGRCSNHALLALDDLGSHEIVFSTETLSPYFSSYAKNLLSDSEVPISRGSIQNKLYTGEIAGKYPIVLLIKEVNEEGDFSAVYWYEKNKKLIPWSGTLSGNRFSATEDDHYDEIKEQLIPRAKIEAKLNGTKISGTWQDFKTKKKLNLELEEL